MPRLILISTFAFAALSLGCATQSAAQQNAAPLSGPPSRIVEFPTATSAGEPREIRVLVDEPALKLASIVLRGGTVLPTHHSDVPVTIMALRGSGTVVAESKRLRLDPAHAVVLAPNVPHAVEPDAGTDLVLLVHHLRRDGEHH
jgi:quercetin dioxygenase-like cupin family protein